MSLKKMIVEAGIFGYLIVIMKIYPVIFPRHAVYSEAVNLITKPPKFGIPEAIPKIRIYSCITEKDRLTMILSDLYQKTRKEWQMAMKPLPIED